jgi:tripartite-type tricarboxylate transporter receptor subunit TctC
MKHLFRTLLACAASAALLAAGAAQAQSFPAGKPVTMIVPFAAGGPTDVVARQLAKAMAKPLGANVIVENKPGAGGTLASEFVARANPDGYTILLHHIGMATSPALYRQLRFNPLTDYEYIGEVTSVPMTLVARPDFPANNMKELVAYVKANSKKINLANAGIGAASHLCGLLFQAAIQTELTTVPYKGTGPAMTDLQGGQVDLMCDQTTTTTQPIIGKRIKAYGATSAKRISSLPDLPTMAEQGYPQLDVGVWHALYAPKGTPKPAVDALVKALQASVKDPEFRTAMDRLGAVPVPDDRVTPEGLRTHLKAEIDKWTPIIKKAGQYAD